MKSRASWGAFNPIVLLKPFRDAGRFSAVYGVDERFDVQDGRIVESVGPIDVDGIALHLDNLAERHADEVWSDGRTSGEHAGQGVLGVTHRVDTKYGSFAGSVVLVEPEVDVDVTKTLKPQNSFFVGLVNDKACPGALFLHVADRLERKRCFEGRFGTPPISEKQEGYGDTEG